MPFVAKSVNNRTTESAEARVALSGVSGKTAIETVYTVVDVDGR